HPGPAPGPAAGGRADAVRRPGRDLGRDLPGHQLREVPGGLTMAVNEHPATRVVRTIVAVGFGVVALLPLIWMALSGFKENTEVTATPLRLLPKTWHVSNYIDIATDPEFLRAMGITFIGAVL